MVSHVIRASILRGAKYFFWSSGGTLVICQKSNKGYITQMLLRFLIFWPRVFTRLYNSIESIALGVRERQNNTLKEKQTMRLKVRYLKVEPKIILIKKTHTHKVLVGPPSVCISALFSCKTVSYSALILRQRTSSKTIS